MSFLGNLRGGCLSRANSPHGLVGNNDVRPVLDLLADGVQLSLVNLSGFARFSLLKVFSNACKNCESVIDGSLGLGGDIVVCFSVQRSSLGVTSESPRDSHILDHLAGVLSSESSVACQRKVLRSNMHIGVGNGTLNGAKMKSSRGHNDLNSAWVELKGVKNFSWERLSESQRSIALPVSSDEILSHVCDLLYKIKL